MKPNSPFAPGRPSPPPRIARLLSEEDAPAFAALCAREPWRLFMPRLNIEASGFAGRNLRCWGAFSGGEMRGVLLRFSNIVIVADADGACGAAFAAVVDTETGVAGVRGTVETVRAVQAHLQRYAPADWEDSAFMHLPRPPQVAPQTLALVRRARPDDLEKLAALYAGAGIMYRSRVNVTTKLAETRVFVVEEAPRGRRRIVSCALLNVEGSDAGLIGGVYTLPDARGRGYAAACTAALSRDLQRDGKLPCLFYENPVAGRVYRRLGFQQVGEWAVLYLTPHLR